jgi:hypothetical protein
MNITTNAEDKNQMVKKIEAHQEKKGVAQDIAVNLSLNFLRFFLAFGPNQFITKNRPHPQIRNNPPNPKKGK